IGWAEPGRVLQAPGARPRQPARGDGLVAGAPGARDGRPALGGGPAVLDHVRPLDRAGAVVGADAEPEPGPAAATARPPAQPGWLLYEIAGELCGGYTSPARKPGAISQQERQRWGRNSAWRIGRARPRPGALRTGRAVLRGESPTLAGGRRPHRGAPDIEKPSRVAVCAWRLRGHMETR